MEKQKESKAAAIIVELKDIAAQNGGNLKPKNVVWYARTNATSALHGCFNWDDGEAAERYREWQARKIIRATVHMIIIGKHEYPVKSYVSFISDRKNGKGYTAMSTILSKKVLRDQLLADALAELAFFETKYAALKELVEAVSEVRKRFVGKKKKGKPFTYRPAPTDRPQPIMHA